MSTGVVEGDTDPQLFLPELIDYWRAGRLPLEKIVRTYPFWRIEEAIRASESGQVIKPVQLMGEGV